MALVVQEWKAFYALRWLMFNKPCLVSSCLCLDETPCI